jgi:hypothetical protein
MVIHRRPAAPNTQTRAPLGKEGSVSKAATCTKVSQKWVKSVFVTIIDTMKHMSSCDHT